MRLDKTTKTTVSKRNPKLYKSFVNELNKNKTCVCVCVTLCVYIINLT